MADASFVKRLLEVHITLRDGEFWAGGNTKIVTGIPIKARIEKTGPPDFNKASIEIRGMLYQDMERLSTLAFRPLFTARNLVRVYAGDENNGLSLAFSGEMTQASADFNAAPDVSFKIEAMTGYFGNVTPSGPTAVKGDQPVAEFIAMQAKKAGCEFRNNGVTARLSNAVFNGSPVAQARAAARQVGAELIIDDNIMTLSPRSGGDSATASASSNRTATAAPSEGARATARAASDGTGSGTASGASRSGTSSGGGTKAVLLNKDTGMLGYPVLTNEGVEVRGLYNPAFRLGGLVKVESIVPRASGVWRIIKLSHELTAFDPGGGPWESRMVTFYPSMSGAGGKI